MLTLLLGVSICKAVAGKSALGAGQLSCLSLTYAGIARGMDLWLTNVRGMEECLTQPGHVKISARHGSGRLPELADFVFPR